MRKRIGSGALIIIVSLLLGSACATGGQTLKAINSWIGTDIDRCIMKWGKPSNEYRLKGGNTIYTWHEVHSQESVASGNGSLLFPYKVETVVKYCDWIMTANPSGIIIDGRYEGNDCY